jgi:type IV pilus assembly protein PilW
MNTPIWQRGFSLIELMIALVLGLGVVAAVATLSLSATGSYRALNQSGQKIENGRYAMSILKDDLEHAGFFGRYSPVHPPPKTVLDLTTNPLINPCDTDILTHSAYPIFYFPVVGYESVPSTCAPDRVANTGVLLIRRAETQPVTSVDAGYAYIQNHPAKNTAEILFPSAGGEVDSWRLLTHIYYIRSYSSSQGDNIPTLILVSLEKKTDTTSSQPIPYFSSQPIIDGIENLQLEFGLDAVPLTDCANETPVLDDGSPNRYYRPSEITCWKDWSNVVAVRVNLLARSTDPDASFTDSKTYVLCGVSVTPTETHYRRNVYTQSVRVAHSSSRREK